MLKKILAVLVLLLAAAGAGATTAMLTGTPIAITGATAATPIVLTTATNTLLDNDQVLVTGVLGNTSANGLWKCHPVSSTTCTLVNAGSGANSVGTVAYASGGTLTPLSVQVTGPGPWFDIHTASRGLVHVWSTAGSTGMTGFIEQASNPASGTGDKRCTASNGGPVDPPSQSPIGGITNPPAVAPPDNYVVAVTNCVRVNVTGISTGAINANLDAYKDTPTSTVVIY